MAAKRKRAAMQAPSAPAAPVVERFGQGPIAHLPGWAYPQPAAAAPAPAPSKYMELLKQTKVATQGPKPQPPGPGATKEQLLQHQEELDVSSLVSCHR
jgi:hypothetical protein